jgi:hypothetical protein
MESQGQNPVLAVLYVPHSLDSGILHFPTERIFEDF